MGGNQKWKRVNMNEKRFEIIDENYVGYYQGTAYLISNTENEWYIWEKKEKAQELVDLLNSLTETNQQLMFKLDVERSINNSITTQIAERLTL